MPRLSMLELQHFLIRVYLGLDFIPHFSEKLLEGPGPRGEDVANFEAFGFSHPESMVIVAGLCEFGAFLGLTFGFWTRIAAGGTALYLLIALFTGGHDTIGFIWAIPGGGWEFPAMWAFLAGSFVLTGGGKWSADAVVRKQAHLPGWLRRLSA